MKNNEEMSALFLAMWVLTTAGEVYILQLHTNCNALGSKVLHLTFLSQKMKLHKRDFGISPPALYFRHYLECFKAAFKLPPREETDFNKAGMVTSLQVPEQMASTDEKKKNKKVTTKRLNCHFLLR